MTAAQVGSALVDAMKRIAELEAELAAHRIAKDAKNPAGYRVVPGSLYDKAVARAEKAEAEVGRLTYERDTYREMWLEHDPEAQKRLRGVNRVLLSVFLEQLALERALCPRDSPRGQLRRASRRGTRRVPFCEKDDTKDTARSHRSSERRSRAVCRPQGA